MHFSLVDRVLEQTDGRIVTCKLVSSAEEYLQDHFATFPVLPGVMMVEALVQAARMLLESPVAGGAPSQPQMPRVQTPMVLGRVRALKYGALVQPGAILRVTVEKLKDLEGGAVEFKGTGHVLQAGDLAGADPAAETPGAVAVSGRLTLRPLSIAS